MKKIFIMAHALELGGAETSLLGLLENFDYSKYEVDLFLLRRNGELLEYIPKKVNILPEKPDYSSLGIPLIESIKRGQIKIAFERLIGKIQAKRRIKQLNIIGEHNIINEYSHKYPTKVLPMINDIEYDVAISFVSPHYFVAKKVNAKKKIAWIHTDYSTLTVDVDSETKMWSQYDKIISISNEVTISFLKTFPSLEDKLYLIENIMPVNYINSLKNEFSVEDEIRDFEGVNILSIGRFTPAKKFTEVPEICRKINELGVKTKWYLIGYGAEEQDIINAIKINGMEENVIILGKKSNPYPYFKACDVYAQPSRYEGKSIAVREAQLLNKPIIITNYATAASQLTDGYDGVIVPMDIDECAKRISEVIGDKNLLNKLSENTKLRDYAQVGEMEKFYYLLENI